MSGPNGIMCGDCCFYDGHNSENDGLCRKNAPMTFDREKRAFWPVVKSDDRCFEFHNKSEKFKTEFI